MALALAALTVVIALLLYTTYEVQYPFSGSVNVGSDAYSQALDDILPKGER